MLNLKVHHIGYLVKKINAAISEFQHLGYVILQDIVYDDSRKVNICFMEKDGYTVELVSPATPDSVVAGLLKKYKNSPYHFCYESTDFENDLAALTKDGYTAIDMPTPAPALGNSRVTFLMNANLGMIELLEVRS
ncbi:MAG: lactoylglutathione lyase [Clostridiales bacterium]|nr:lactoylglutathione lyase [Clostridiales bacterium]